MEKTIKDWLELYDQYVNGYHMEPNDIKELIRLNHIIMEATHVIHNDNMLSKSH